MHTRNSLAVEWRPIDRVIPYENNPRRISEAAVRKVAASIKTFGWQQPIVAAPNAAAIGAAARSSFMTWVPPEDVRSIPVNGMDRMMMPLS